MSLLQDDTMKILTKALDATSVRHKAISNNIANVNTKDFKADKVLFEEQLSKAINLNKGLDGGITLAATHPKHFGGVSTIDQVQPVTVKDKSTSMRLDGNNVDIDIEMAELAANQMSYEALLRRINGKISSLKAVISGGRG